MKRGDAGIYLGRDNVGVPQHPAYALYGHAIG